MHRGKCDNWHRRWAKNCPFVSPLSYLTCCTQNKRGKKQHSLSSHDVHPFRFGLADRAKRRKGVKKECIVQHAVQTFLTYVHLFLFFFSERSMATPVSNGITSRLTMYPQHSKPHTSCSCTARSAQSSSLEQWTGGSACMPKCQRNTLAGRLW